MKRRSDDSVFPSFRADNSRKEATSVDWPAGLEHHPGMPSAARTVVLFGMYLVALGLIVLLIPNVLLSMFGLPNTDEVWIRLLGLVLLLLGAYYIASGRGEATAFVRATVPGRLFAAAGLVVIAALFGHWTLMLFALPDVAGAVWTRSALRRSADATSSA